MIYVAKFFAVLVSTATLSGCMCMMPMRNMDNMDKGKKDDMAGMEMGEKGGHAMMDQTARRPSGAIAITFSTVPEKAKMGENRLRVKLADGVTGRSIDNAEVVFRFTMMLPGMMVQEATAMRTQEGMYEASANLSMAGQWDIAVEIKQPAQPGRRETFAVIVS